MNLKTTAALAAIAIMGAPTYADVTNTSSTWPANATVIYPQPDSRVDLGPNASPLGLQQISVMFTGEVTVNSNCTGEACIYKEGDDTPLQSAGVDRASVDATQSNMGSILFPRSCTGNGRYRVTIPEGFWSVGGSGKSGAFDLYYEIMVAQRIQPAESVVTELKEFRLEFPDFKEAKVLDASKIEFFRHSSSDEYGISVSVPKGSDGTPANYVLISLNAPVTEPGDYSLFIGAEAAAGISYGEDDKETREPNTEALYHYTVSQLAAPSIEPAEGPVESFATFELTVPEGSDFWFVNDKAASFIYQVDDNGSILPDALYRLTGNRIEGTDTIILTIIEDGEPVESVTPTQGNYALKLASGLFSGSWNGEFINSAPYIYYYQAIGDPSGIDSIDNGNRNAIKHAILTGIYTIDGKKISKENEKGDITVLPEGIYIIDGQKTYVGK